MREPYFLWYLALCHLLVDGLCAAVVFGLTGSGELLAGGIFLYNTLAFACQSLTGLLADRIRRHREGLALSFGLLALGALLPVPVMARIVLIGLGNCLFHVAGGALTLERNHGKAGPLGVFVAPGAYGILLGTLFPSLRLFFAAALCLAALVLFPLSAACGVMDPDRAGKREKAGGGKGDVLAASLFLTGAVAVRALGGSVVSFPWKQGAFLSFLMVTCVFAGKMAGGFLCDRAGARRAAWLSVPAAALLIAFGSSRMLPSLAGQFLLNLTMPITLWLLYRLMPDMPGYAFGLAAAALWPGAIAGRFLTLTGPARWIFVLACFLFGLWAILRAGDGAERAGP